MEDTVSSAIVQAVATVGGMGAMLTWLWSMGPGAKISHIEHRVDKGLDRLEVIVEGMRSDLQQHRDAVLHEQAAHRERIQRLEIITEQVLAEAEGRARRQPREDKRVG